jgi:phage host-nuclease inhibitor protein Gam
MNTYVTIRNFSEMTGLSTQEVLEMAREVDALETVNNGKKANIYVCVETMMECLDKEIADTLKAVNYKEDTLCI